MESDRSVTDDMTNLLAEIDELIQRTRTREDQIRASRLYHVTMSIRDRVMELEARPA